MNALPDGTLPITLGFIAYFLLHSLTASLWLKGVVARRCPDFVPYYRIAFNALAGLAALPLIYLLWHYPGEPLIVWAGVWHYVSYAIIAAAFALFFYSLTLYDMSEFWGTRQLRAHVHEVRDLEQMQISVFHRFVRHPWYFLLLVILWSRDLSDTQLVTNLLLTLYLFIGSRMEERKLIALHGESYRQYRRRVAGLLPLPWKILTAEEAKRLLADEHE